MSLILTLAIDNLDRSEFFYRSLLGLSVERFRPKDSNHELLLLNQGDATVLLREADLLEAQHPAAFQHLQRQPRGVGFSLDFQVDNLKAICSSLGKHQLCTLYELDDRQHGISELWLYDPDNYLIILTQIDKKPG
ncbi:MAG: hypothetical protein J7K75_12740 [Desulfuromonas sp.]|nr:hypothetical protein [Desulfuromonas sp.]